MNLLQRWRDSFKYRHGLDQLLAETPAADADLRERVEWVTKIVSWVRIFKGNISEKGVGSRSHNQTTRLKYILHVLNNNPDFKRRVTGCLRSMINDTTALELFMHVGVPNQQGFIGEFVERMGNWLLPQAPDDKNLEFIFSETFKYRSDIEWIDQMDPTVFRGWLEMFCYTGETNSNEPSKVLGDAKDALFLLSQSVRTVGLSRFIRNRVNENDFRKLPFYELTEKVDRLIAASPSERDQAYNDFNRVLDCCFETVAEVYLHYRDNGVSIELVYQTERLKALLRRCRSLGKLLIGNEKNAQFVQDFFALLVRENIYARKITRLLSDNLALVCQKIVETNAETGEHYITRDKSAFLLILKKAWGGGAVTALTTLVKFLLYHVSVAPFFSGFLAVANYSISFISLQFLGFTLATKQPAMTATVLASKVEEANDNVEPLIDEIVYLVRSQLAAVVGNLSMVVPVVVLIDFTYMYIFHAHLTDISHASHSIESFSILGPTPIYAAGTGVLLWLSSVFAGWFGNWFNFHGLPEAIEHNSRLRFVLGPERARRFGKFLSRNAPGLAASLSLAFLLGMTPQLAAFFGFPFDVRHVTLSSGALTAAAMSMGHLIFWQWSFWLAVVGILSMGFFNLTVSFALALIVAIWAKRVSAPKRDVIYKALLRKFLRQPWLFLFPFDEKHT